MIEHDKSSGSTECPPAIHAYDCQAPGAISERQGELLQKATGILTHQDARSVKIRLSLVALFVTVLALTIASVGNYYSLPHSPEDVADRYLSALQKGNYTEGLDDEAYSSFSHTYLSDAIYASAQGRIESYTIVGSSPASEGRSEVAVRVRMNGQEHNLSLPFALEPRSGPFNDTWKLAEPAQNYLQLTAPVELSEIMVNGHPLGLPATRRTLIDGNYAWLMPLLPGKYTFSLPATSYYVLSPVNRTVISPLPDGRQMTSQLNLEIRPSPRMWRETDELISSWLSRCESSRQLDVPGCPNSARQSRDSTATISNVRWKLLSRPAFYLIQDSTNFSHWYASRYRQAEMELTYLADGIAQREIINFTIEADVTSDGSHADISVGLGDKKTNREQLQEVSAHEAASRSTLQRFALAS